MLPPVQRSINTGTQLHEALRLAGLGVEPARIVFGGFQTVTMDRFLLLGT